MLYRAESARLHHAGEEFRYTEWEKATVLTKMILSLSVIAGCSCNNVFGATITNNTIIVTEQSTGRVLTVDLDGTINELSVGGFLQNPLDATFTVNGELFVAESGSGGSGGKILQIDPDTGDQTIVADSGFIRAPVGITSDALGNLYVTDQGRNNQSVIRLATTTFAQTLISDSVLDPYGLELTAFGELIVVANGSREILAFDGAGPTIVSGGNGEFIEPIGIDVDAAGALFLANQQDSRNFGNILRIDPATGFANLIAEGPMVSGATGISLDASGNIFLTNQTTSQLVRIDRDTLQQTVVASGFGGVLGGVEIVGSAGIGPLGVIPEPSGAILLAALFCSQLMSGGFRNTR